MEVTAGAGHRTVGAHGDRVHGVAPRTATAHSVQKGRRVAMGHSGVAGACGIATAHSVAAVHASAESKPIGSLGPSGPPGCAVRPSFRTLAKPWPPGTPKQHHDILTETCHCRQGRPVHERRPPAQTAQPCAQRMRLCYVWLYTWPGIPITYQGDEQALVTPGSGLAYWGREFMASSAAWSQIPTEQDADGEPCNGLGSEPA